MSLRNIVGCISSLRKELTDFEAMNDSISRACNVFIRSLQDCSVKNPIGEYRAFWYIENNVGRDSVRLRYGISNVGTVSREIVSGSDVEWSLVNLVNVIDQFCKGKNVGWNYFIVPNGTTFFRGLPVLFSDGVGLFGDDPLYYAKEHCELKFKVWETGEIAPLALLYNDNGVLEDDLPADTEDYMRREIKSLIADTVHARMALDKYGGKLEDESYKGARYAFHKDGVKYVLSVLY